MTYKPADLFDHLDECWDDPHCLVCINPPTYTGGFERRYETGGRIGWSEPRYRLFDAEAGLADLMNRAWGAKCLLLCYQERATDDAVGTPVYIQDHLRRNTDKTGYLHVYIVPNRFEEALEIADGLTVGRMRLAVAVRRAVRHLRTRGQVHKARGLAGDWLVRRTAQHLGTGEA